MKRRRDHSGFRMFIMMALLREGPLSPKQLEEKTAILASHFRSPLETTRTKDEISVTSECRDLLESRIVRLNDAGEYELTQPGREEAGSVAKRMEKAAGTVQAQFLSPKAAARNTVIADLLLAALKLSAGFFSGSVALIADGTDASIDTASACIVWAGMKLKKELVGTLMITLMMFATAISVGYESIITILDAVSMSGSPISMPYLVITSECVALIAALGLFYYQRFVGRRSGSLALISQSVDSKNHVYVAAAVIVGAVFSIAGIHFVDALIGGFIACKIFVDGFGLAKELLQSVRGEATDLSKYGLPLEKRWQLGRLETFRAWILYSIKEDNLNTREAVLNSLERTFKTSYIPILSEFEFGLGKDYDFEANLDHLIEPLADEGYLLEKDEELLLTEKGNIHVTRLFRNIRHRQIR